MANQISFMDALKIENAFNFEKGKAGKMQVRGSDELSALLEGMREVGKSNDRALHQVVGAAIREPIRTLARYRAWTQVLFDPYSVALGDENPIALWSPIGAAFVSSPDGRAEYVRPGVQRITYPRFKRIKAAVEIGWDDLAVARWNVLQRALEESADAMALQRDTLAKVVIDAAITLASHNTNVSTTVGKSDFDTIVKNAEQYGFPITQVIANPTRIRDMSGWTNGTTSALPAYWAPQSAAESMYRELWFNGYGNLRYFLSHNVPMNKIYFAGDAPQVGYAQDHGGARSVSDMDIDNMADKHLVWEDVAYYVGNIYNVWSITIT